VLDQIAVKDLHAKARVVTDLCGLPRRAAATDEVSAEGLQRAGVDGRQAPALALHKAAEVCRRPHVSNRTRKSVPLLCECLCEAVDV
jgi:hypothetical protein